MSTRILTDLETDVHVSANPWLGNGWRRSRAGRRWLIRIGRDRYPVSAYVLAVVELQRLWRGVLLRRRVLRKYVEGTFQRQWKVEEQQVLQLYRSAPRAPEAAFTTLVRQVQARWRTVLLRSEFRRLADLKRWPVYWIAAATIQRAWVDYQYHKTHKRHRNRSRRFFRTKADAAASKIQLLWKGLVQKRIFSFLARLIRFRENGDPSLMLKCIDLGEASMMDAASGLHVRFRLAGSQFPPIIVYKVFTHRHVADLGYLAPKDYAAIAQRKQDPKYKATVERHNKKSASSPSSGRSSTKHREGWYQRDDCNPWRPVDQSVLTNAEEIALELTAKSTKHANVIPQGAAYHYTRLKREEERLVQKKQTRRKWLAELYSDEQARQRPHRTKEEVQKEAGEIFASLTDEEVGEEAGRLAEWTSALDFFAYRQDWLKQATTAPSNLNKK